MNLIKFLNSTAEARKVFGQRELKIIEKQLLGIKLTQSEKNRLSRDIRKKFKFIKEISKYENEFGLKKGAIIKENIDEVLEVIKRHQLFNKIKRIILFGSTAENERTFRSDIDIAIEFKSINPKQERLFKKEIIREVNEKVDIQIYNRLLKKIRKEIDQKGKVLLRK